ncbi:hypothetical protein [Streptomyces sp. NPDC057545]|uniref:hypothetical protein n=1 Tax=Streptomyces sp. NPDC057545 TaxID=3346164 RepID=UPI0036BFC9D0
MSQKLSQSPISDKAIPAVQESNQGAALFFLVGDLPGKHGAVGVRADGSEGQAWGALCQWCLVSAVLSDTP